MAKQRRQTLLLEAQSLLASGGFGTAEAGVRQSVRATAALAARGQWEGGSDSAPAAQLTPAKATPSPPPASAVPPADDPAAKLASRLQRQQEREECVRKLAESNAAAAEAKDSQASNAQAAVELEYKRKIAEELAKQKAKEAAEHAEQAAREVEAERALAVAEQNAAKKLAEQQTTAKEREQQQQNEKAQTHSNAGASGLRKTGLLAPGAEPPAAPTAASESPVEAKSSSSAEGTWRTVPNKEAREGEKEGERQKQDIVVVNVIST
jgi:flagellar biosynthesis GTPase FlhF